MNSIIAGMIGVILTAAGLLGLNYYTIVTTSPETSFGGTPVVTAPQGGTGFGSTTAGNVGKFLKVSNHNPLTYVFDTAAGGSGGGGGFWSTTTNNLIIYPTSDNYTVSIGDDATTTSEFWFDPVVSKAFLTAFTANNSTSTNATSTKLAVTGTASTSALIVSNLNNASCDVKASAAGVLSCGTDATGSGGTPDSKWATSTDFAIYPSGVTNSLIVGRANQYAQDCLICLFATSTMSESEGPLIFASTTPSYDGSFLKLIDGGTGVTQLTIGADGGYDSKGGAEFVGTGAFGAQVSIVGATGLLQIGDTGVQLSDDGDGALTLTSIGGGNNESLTVNLDDTADTAVWSSSTGVTAIDWGALNLTTSGRLTSGTMTVTSLTSALLLTDGAGVFGEYAGSSCTNQFVRSLSALGVATCASINNGDWSGTDLSVANGGTGLSTFGGTNTILYTTSADTLSSESAFTYTASTDRLTVVNASTTDFTIAGTVKVPYETIGFTYSTTSWTGTTTLLLGPAAGSQQFDTISCETTTGTVNVSVYDGTNRMDLLNASSTIGIFNFTTNNTFNKSESRRVDIGTPASSPVKVACTAKYRYLNDI